MVECLTRDRRAAGSSLTGVTALWSLSRHIYPSLVLVQPRKTCPCLTERLLMGHKESNQTNKQKHDIILHVFCCYMPEEREKYETCTFKIAQIWGFVHVMHLSPFEHVFWVLQSTHNIPFDCQLRNTQINVRN